MQPKDENTPMEFPPSPRSQRKSALDNLDNNLRVSMIAVDDVLETFLMQGRDNGNEEDDHDSQMTHRRFLYPSEDEARKTLEAQKLTRKLRREANERKRRKEIRMEKELERMREEVTAIEVDQRRGYERTLMHKIERLERRRKDREIEALERKKQFEVLREQELLQAKAKCKPLYVRMSEAHSEKPIYGGSGGILPEIHSPQSDNSMDEFFLHSPRVSPARSPLRKAYPRVQILEEDRISKEKERQAAELRAALVEKRRNYGQIVKSQHFPQADSSKAIELENMKQRIKHPVRVPHTNYDKSPPKRLPPSPRKAMQMQRLNPIDHRSKSDEIHEAEKVKATQFRQNQVKKYFEEKEKQRTIEKNVMDPLYLESLENQVRDQEQKRLQHSSSSSTLQYITNLELTKEEMEEEQRLAELYCDAIQSKLTLLKKTKGKR